MNENHLYSACDGLGCVQSQGYSTTGAIMSIPSRKNQVDKKLRIDILNKSQLSVNLHLYHPMNGPACF